MKINSSTTFTPEAKERVLCGHLQEPPSQTSAFDQDPPNDHPLEDLALVPSGIKSVVDFKEITPERLGAKPADEVNFRLEDFMGADFDEKLFFKNPNAVQGTLKIVSIVTTTKNEVLAILEWEEISSEGGATDPVPTNQYKVRGVLPVDKNFYLIANEIGTAKKYLNKMASYVKGLVDVLHGLDLSDELWADISLSVYTGYYGLNTHFMYINDALDKLTVSQRGIEAGERNMPGNTDLSSGRHSIGGLGKGNEDTAIHLRFRVATTPEYLSLILEDIAKLEKLLDPRNIPLEPAQSLKLSLHQLHHDLVGRIETIIEKILVAKAKKD